MATQRKIRPSNARKSYDLDASIPYMIYRISNRLNQLIQERLRPARTTLTKWRLLSSLRSRGTSTVRELAKCTVMQQPVVSRVLTEMERDGLIVRRSSAQDRREVLIKLTNEGIRLFEVAHEISEQHCAEALRGFSQQEIRSLSRALKRIHVNIGIS